MESYRNKVSRYSNMMYVLTKKRNRYVGRMVYADRSRFKSDGSESPRKSSISDQQGRVKVLVSQLCLTLCNPKDWSLPGSSVLLRFSRREYWSELPFPSPGDLLDPGIESRSPSLQVDYLPSKPPWKRNGTTKKLILPGPWFHHYSLQNLELHTCCLFFFILKNYLFMFNFKIFNSYMRSQT